MMQYRIIIFLTYFDSAFLQKQNSSILWDQSRQKQGWTELIQLNASWRLKALLYFVEVRDNKLRSLHISIMWIVSASTKASVKIYICNNTKYNIAPSFVCGQVSVRKERICAQVHTLATDRNVLWNKETMFLWVYMQNMQTRLYVRACCAPWAP